MHTLQNLSLLVYFLSMPSACINISSFETGEVLPEGEGQFHLGLSDYSGKTNSREVKNQTRQIWPNVELGYHRGFLAEWEWDLKLTVAGTYETGIKRQFVRGSHFNLALANKIVYVYYRAENAEFFNLWDYRIPLSMSYRWSDLFTFYVTPQYVSRWFLKDNKNYRSDWGGCTLGGLIHQKFAAETTYLRSATGVDSFQVGIAIFFY